MKNVIRTTMAVLAVLVAAGSVSAQAAPEIVYIDTQRILEEAPGMQAVRDSLQAAEAQAQEQLAPLQQELEQMAETLEAQQGTMTADVRRQREQEFVTTRQELQVLFNELQGQAQEMQQRLMQPVMARVRAAIQEIRSERGYAFVLDLSSPGLLAADPDRDITAQVLQRLQAN